MVDEDFVMGYVCGFNDGVGSGGGGDVPTGETITYNDVTIAKQWNISGTPFSLALLDVHSERLICGTKAEKILSATDNWDRLVVHYWVSIGLIYDGDIVSVASLEETTEVLALNGTPYAYAYTEEIQSVYGTASLGHSTRTLTSGDIDHSFSIYVAPAAQIIKKTYRQNKVESETVSERTFGGSTVLSWTLRIHPDGSKALSYYNPDKLFIPVSSKGILGVPKGTSIQQILQTGLLVPKLKESLISAGENVTLEEV